MAGGKPPQPDPDCAFCYGAWNSMDRYFMQDCMCKAKCVEPKCREGRNPPHDDW